MQHTTQHSSFCATHHKKRNARLFYTKQQLKVKWRSLWWHRKFWHSRLWVSQLPGCCCNRLCGNLVVKNKGTDGLVNRLYKKNSTWKGIYNGTTKRREWNNGFCTDHDSIWCRHNVRPIDCGSLWIFFSTVCRLDFFQFNRTWSNTTTRDQIYSDDTTTVIKCTNMNIASMQFVIDCLSCFFYWLPIAWKEEAAIRNKGKTRWR